MDPWNSQLGIGPVAAFLLVCLQAGGVAADASKEPRFARGTQHVGLLVGYGTGFSLGFAGDGDGREVEYVAFLPRWGIGLSDPLAPDTWHHGNVELLVEGSYLSNSEPRRGHFAGASLMLRYNFLAWERFVPFVEGGAGVGQLDFDLRDQDDGFSFLVQAGVGVSALLTERTALEIGWRYHHISNAGLHDPNNGINSSLPMVGLTFRLD